MAACCFKSQIYVYMQKEAASELILYRHANRTKKGDVQKMVAALESGIDFQYLFDNLSTIGREIVTFRQFLVISFIFFALNFDNMFG